MSKEKLILDPKQVELNFDKVMFLDSYNGSTAHLYNSRVGKYTCRFTITVSKSSLPEFAEATFDYRKAIFNLSVYDAKDENGKYYPYTIPHSFKKDDLSEDVVSTIEEFIDKNWKKRKKSVKESWKDERDAYNPYDDPYYEDDDTKTSQGYYLGDGVYVDRKWW